MILLDPFVRREHAISVLERMEWDDVVLGRSLSCGICANVNFGSFNTTTVAPLGSRAALMACEKGIRRT